MDIEIPSELSGLVQKYHDTYIIDDSLTDLDVLLISIYLIEEETKEAKVNYEEVKNLFLSFGRKIENFRVNLSQATKKSILLQEGKTIRFISLKKINQILNKVGKSSVYLIKSGEEFTAIKLFEEFLIKEVDNENILVCDTYISHESLYAFYVLKGKIKSLKILTSKIHDEEKFESCKEKMKKEFKISIEVKKNRNLHDRYIIFGNKCWSIGHSIKDLGRKDTIIRDISEVCSSMRDLFDERFKKEK